VLVVSPAKVGPSWDWSRGVDMVDEEGSETILVLVKNGMLVSCCLSPRVLDDIGPIEK